MTRNRKEKLLTFFLGTAISSIDPLNEKLGNPKPLLFSTSGLSGKTNGGDTAGELIVEFIGAGRAAAWASRMKDNAHPVLIPERFSAASLNAILIPLRHCQVPAFM